MEPFTSLPAGALTAYGDLLTALFRAPISAKGVSYIKRSVKGRDYWYLQYVIGNRKRSHYLGRDSEEISKRIAAARKLASGDAADRGNRERLVATGIAAGLAAPSVAEGRVYEALVQSGLFEGGAVLVGTHAFIALGNQLGVAWQSSTRTEDIDIEHDPRFVLVAPDFQGDLPALLSKADKGFFAVPALDARQPSTSFSIRGKQLSVSILTPEFGKPGAGVVVIPGLNIAAEPVRFLDYTLEDAQPAAIAHGAGLLIRIPHAGRYALHKLVVAQRRRAFDAAKSRKDIWQAMALLECLRELRPGDVSIAKEAAVAMPPGFQKHLASAIATLPTALGSWLSRS